MRHTTLRDVRTDRFGRTFVKSRQSWAELYAFEVDRAADAPVFRQIYLQLRSAILSGTNSSRDEAAIYTRTCSSNSAFRGPQQSRLSSSFSLRDMHPARRGQEPSSRPIFLNLSRQFTAARSDRYRARKTATSSRELGGFVDVTSQSDERPFNLGRTLVDARTAELWRKLSARSLRSFGRHHLGYADPHGMLELRKSVCDYLQAARAVRCEPEQVVITAGTQQALDIVIRVMQGPDKEVWIEDPGYSLTHLALIAAGAKVCPVPVDQHGINVTEGIRRAPKARAVFITPSHQFPKGVVLSMARRLELLAWARESRRMDCRGRLRQ